MNILDIILIVIILISMIRGFQLGLIRQLFSLLGFVVAIYMAYHFSQELAPYLHDYIPVPKFDIPSLYKFSQTFNIEDMFYNAIAFLIIFIVTKLSLNIGSQILHQIASLPGLKTINRFTGALIGFIQGFILIIIIVHIISVMPWLNVQQYLQGSVIANFVMEITPIITEMLYQLWNTSVKL